MPGFRRDDRPLDRDASAVVRSVPAALLVAGSCGFAWFANGSVEAADWLPLAIGAAAVVGVLLASGAATRPPLSGTAALVALIALAGWAALSLTWSPLPSLARDEALLTAAYAAALAVPLLARGGERERLMTLGAVVLGSGVLAVATAVRLRYGAGPLDLYDSGRLNFPISYQNAQAAMFLLAFWPAVALAARAAGAAVVRVGALGAAVAVLAGGLLTQSKGGALGLGVSAVFFFGVAPGRLRTLVPAAAAFAIVGPSFETLTEPFRAEGDVAKAAAIADAGARTLWLTAAGLAAGLVYVLVDRRLDLSARARRGAAVLVIAALAAGAAAGASVFLVQVDHPVGFFADKWRSFKHLPEREQTSTHLLSLGSNRYDFWRVAAGEFRHHPVAGIGARGFGPAYLKEGRSRETPARAHSLALELLSEQGVIGFLLLAAAVSLPLAAGIRRLDDLGRAGALAACVYWLAHAGVDWNWTFPALGIPFFVLLGAAASEDASRRLRLRVALPGAALALAVALFAFAPAWLSARFTNAAYDAGPATARRDLRWAHRLDPLAIEPLIARAALARTPAAAIRPLERAVDLQPRAADTHYLLGLAYLRAGRTTAARESLLEAKRLDPHDPTVDRALRAARRRR